MNVQPPISTEQPAERLRVAALDLVVNQTYRRQALSPVTAAVLCVALWPVTDRALLAGWVGLLCVISVWRHCFARSYLRAPAEDRRQRRWEWHFFISLLAASCAWGVGAWMVMPADSPAHQALVYSFAVGMVGGSAVLYGVHRLSTLLAMPMLVLPSIIYLCSFGDRFHVVLAAGGVMLLLGAAMGSSHLGNALRRTIELTEKLNRQARRDALSGLGNRRAFAEFGEWMVAHSAPAALIMIDVDHFKAINDRYGHQVGDRLISAYGQLLDNCVDEGQCAARIGGEEFALLLPGTDVATAGRLATELLGELRQLSVARPGGTAQCTVSIGYAVSTERTADGFEALLKQADEALYAAKRGGRDRVVAYLPNACEDSQPQAAA